MGGTRGKKKKLASYYDSHTLYFFCLGRDIEPTINVKRKGKGRIRFGEKTKNEGDEIAGKKVDDTEFLCERIAYV